MADGIFRKVSLERLASPEQLDLLMQVTTPKGWIALLALGSLLVVAVVWSIVGRIPEKVSGQGLLLKGGQMLDIVSLTSGQITAVYADVGDTVQEGQVIARIAQPELLEKLRSSKGKLIDLENQREMLTTFGSRDSQLQKASTAQQRVTLEQTNQSLTRRIKWLEEKVASQRDLLDKGLITKQNLLDTRTDIDNSKQEIEKNLGQLKQLAVQELQSENQRQRDLETNLQSINETKRNIEEIDYQLNMNSNVLSPYAGLITGISRDHGKYVNTGDVLMSIEPTDKTLVDLAVVIYVPAGEGKKVQPGMKVQVSPTTVKQEEYGSMLGMVSFVSDYPATSQEIMRVTENENLAKMLSGNTSPIEVHVNLIPDPHTQSGYKWSSPKGPPVQVHTGTICLATITTSDQAPISMVIPLFKRYLLGEGVE
jgi:HlyD family secretion protein